MSRKRRNNSSNRSATSKLRWFKADLHTHTPASHDYEEPKITYLQWLQTARSRGLDIVAITDHNTVAGISAIRHEIEWLTRLQEQNRLTDEEKSKLAEWQRLANEIVVLPGFEFTATFGFHILGIFPPETSVRELEHILLRLHVPAEKLDAGTTETGASTDVLTAYEIIAESGGIAIAAHANSSHGVAMRNFPFGGQTKIAYTQDDNLSALEVTDLESRSRKATARFFNGSKPEYPRKMHCIQGSDAHRLDTDTRNKRLGIGERATELLLPEPTFEAIKELFASRSFDRTRPFRSKEKVVDHLAAARAEGPNQTQSFHETASKRGGRQAVVLADVCAFANTDGGAIFIGAGARKGRVKGLSNPKQVIKELQQALSERLTPPLEARFEVLQSEGASVVRISVDPGDEKPYCLDGSKFYVRNDAETSLAVRDEIVALVLESIDLRGDVVVHNGQSSSSAASPAKNGKPASARGRGTPRDKGQNASSSTADVDDPFYLPQDGVEIVGKEVRNGTAYYVVRDLRNGRSVSNVTRKGARKLWNYAISRYEDNPITEDQIRWKGNVGVVHAEKRAGKQRFDLALREGKELRIFFGVTADGMEGAWATFVKEAEKQS